MTTKTRTVRRPQEIEESRMQGYFVISKRDASIAVTNRLTGSQCRLWLYLMIVDPFADYTAGGEIKYHDLPSIAEIAVAVGSSLDSVDKDLRKLRQLGLYEYRTVTVQGHNSTAAKAKLEAERLKSKTKCSPKPIDDNDSANLSGASANLSGASANLSGASANLSGASANLSGASANLSGNLEAKPLLNESFSPPSDPSNYSNFIQNLSKAERENFRDFCSSEVSNYQQPVVDIDDWLAGKNKAGENRYDIQYQKYLAAKEKESLNGNDSTNPSTHCGAANSTKVQKFENWNASTHEGQHHTLMNLGLAKFCENATSKAWYEWARAKHPERFIEVPE